MGWRVLGQEPSVRVLQESLRTRRIHHAYLISGPDGVGKKTLALDFIAAFNCEEGTGIPCWRCASCRRIEQGTDPDLHWLAPDGATVKIGQIRNLQKELSLHPYQSRFKTGVIEQAEKMTAEAANSLLKTLEEPSGKTVLLLITTLPESLLPTIRSRCMGLKLRRVPTEVIKSELLSLGAEACQARILAGLSNGSLGWAKQALHGDLMEYRGNLYHSLAGVKKADTGHLLALSATAAEDKSGVPRTLELMKAWYNDLLMLKVGNDDGIVNFDFRESLRRESSLFSTEEVIGALEAIEETVTALRSYVNHQLTLDVLFLRLSGRLRVPSLKMLL